MEKIGKRGKLKAKKMYSIDIEVAMSLVFCVSGSFETVNFFKDIFINLSGKEGIKDDLVAADWSLLVPQRLSSKSLKFFPGQRKNLNKVLKEICLDIEKV